MSSELETRPKNLSTILASVDVKKRFEEILGARAAAFTSSIMSLYNANPQLQKANPLSILQSAVIAATLDLPVNQNLGFAFIIPYGDYAQFQMGYKGFIQLAIRTGKYKTIHATEVYRDEIESWNALTGTFEATAANTWKLRNKGDFRDVVGYMAYFKLLNGFEKTLYMTTEEIQGHAKRYSKSFTNPKGIWVVNPHAMSLKTVIKLLLSKYGLLSVQMEKAMEVDQAVVDTTGEISYEDRPADEPVVSKPTGADKKITEDQLKLLFVKMEQAEKDFGITEAGVKLYIKENFAKEHRADLTMTELTQLLKWLSQEPPDGAVK
jgi:recombination protein RecT